MHIEDIFEDLEAQFESVSQQNQQGALPGSTRSVQIELKSQDSVKLIAPIIGLDFIAGLDIINPNWRIFNFLGLQELKFQFESAERLPLLRTTTLSLSGFLEGFNLPCRIQWNFPCSEDSAVRWFAGTLHSISSGLLVTSKENQCDKVCIPISSLREISLDFDSVLTKTDSLSTPAVDNPSTKKD